MSTKRRATPTTSINVSIVEDRLICQEFSTDPEGRASGVRTIDTPLSELSVKQRDAVRTLREFAIAGFGR
jgi:hypothetical protein